MNQIDQDRRKQVNILLLLLKIMYLMFSAIPIFDKVFGNQTAKTLFSTSNIFASLPIILIMCTILTAFALFSYAKYNFNVKLLWIEVPLLFAIYILTLSLTGLQASRYKFIFLFVIVSYTMECSAKFGMAICAGACTTLLGFDLIYANHDMSSQYFQEDLVLSCMFFTVSIILSEYIKVQKEHIVFLNDRANNDGLTGIYNHRYFYESFEKKCNKCDKENMPISLIIFDIDYFKIYNDTFGHLQGDNALKHLADIVKKSLTPEKVFCRYGGEEFVIILPGLNLQEAKAFATEIRNKIRAEKFEGEEALPDKNFTVSVGVACKEKGEKYTDTFRRADNALYRAKYLRRDCVEIYASALDKMNDIVCGDKVSALNTLKTFISIIDSRDSYTFQHTERVVYYCEIYADYTKMDTVEKHNLIYSAYLHDIGKINVDRETLVKSTSLTEEEWCKLKNHCKDGFDIINKLPEFKDIAVPVLQHHERYDGTGYPNGVKGKNISINARIINLADSFDAMTHERPYNLRKTTEQAFEEIEACKGTQFDPEIADEFVAALKAELKK